MSYAGLEARST